jgi:glucose/mannose transport system substrate-binding protein
VVEDRGESDGLERAIRHEEEKMMKRAIVAAMGLTLIVAACSSNKSTTSPATTGGTGSGKVEVFSWWTAPGEKEALDALVKVFNEKYPTFTFENAAVAGGAGSNARAVLATRLTAGKPPASWQSHAGQEVLSNYADAGELQSLNSLYDQEGWKSVMPPALVDLLTENGNIYAVPVNIHRANVAWYNTKVLSDNGVTVPKTWDEFFTAADKLKAAGITPLGLGNADNFAVKQLFETILLATLGPDKYNGLWNGSTDWNGPEVKAAIQTFSKALTYANSDYSSLTWDQAAGLVAEGKAAFTVMGDWANGFFKAKGLKQETDYNWAASPGTDGVFDMLADVFVLPKGSPNEAGTIAWLKIAGSKEGEDAFNPIKGSIPARTDADPSVYDTYQKWSLEQWKTDTIVGSLTHGAAASSTWSTDVDTALGLFLSNNDEGAFQKALAQACVDAGKCS